VGPTTATHVIDGRHRATSWPSDVLVQQHLTPGVEKCQFLNEGSCHRAATPAGSHGDAKLDRDKGVAQATIGNVGFMNNHHPDPPEPTIDEEPDRAPGGANADLSESDVGAASIGRPVTPDVPLSAQRDEAEVPDEVQAPEPPETTEAPDDSPSEPSA
jgi:hypothetical protein